MAMAMVVLARPSHPIPSHPPTNTPLVQQHNRVKLGALEEWVLTEARTGADSGMVEDVNHPFHIHVNHFQVRVRGCPRACLVMGRTRQHAPPIQHTTTSPTRQRQRLGLIAPQPTTQQPHSSVINHNKNTPTPIQIVDMSHGAGVDFEVGDWRDSISLPLLPNG